MAGTIVEESIHFDVLGARCEGVLAYPDSGTPAESWLLLAPHPQMGGRMSNNVIQALAQKGAASGRATLRFNYRGVGESELAPPEGMGIFDYWAMLERDRRYELLIPDVTVAHETLRDAVPGARVVHVGYSLGAILAGMTGGVLRPAAIVAIAPPTLRVSLAAYEACVVPKFFITGDDDFAFSHQRFVDEYATMPEPKTHIHMPGHDHFWRGKEDALVRAVFTTLGE